MGIMPENADQILEGSSDEPDNVTAYRGTTLNWVRLDTEWGLEETEGERREDYVLDNMQEVSMFDSTQFSSQNEAYKRAEATAKDKVDGGSYARRNGIDTTPIVIEFDIPRSCINEDESVVLPEEKVLYDRHHTDENELRGLHEVPGSHISNIHYLDSHKESNSDTIPEEILDSQPEKDPILKELSGSGGALSRHYD